MQRQRLIIGVSGSSAPQLAWTTLRALRGHPDIETHLVISRGADKTIQLEMGAERSDFEALADVCYDPGDLGAI
jgi:3-polyprenyl-4-hydroxybenzoate decarboxylase